jgi:hypothetical protein
MGWIVVLGVIGIGGLLLWQNLSGITLLFFGGIMTVTLPIAVWVILFTFTGIVSSLTLQFLYGFGRSFAQPKASPPMPSRPSSPPPSPSPSSRPEREREETRSPIPSVSPPSTDWERESGGDDWSRETPPPEPTVRQNPEIFDRFDKTVPNEEPTDFEVPQSPKASTQTGSIYSYSYRTAKQTRDQNADQVYDANYRIIIPPSREVTDEPAKAEEEEDWI